MHRTTMTIFIGLSLIVFMLWGCSDDDDTITNGGGTSAAQETIGPGGGTIEIPGKVKLVIPPGAISDTIEFTITINDTLTQTPLALSLISPVFTITPTPFSFDSAATLTIWYESPMPPGTDETDVEIYTYNGSNWHDLTTIVNIAQDHASAPVFHLSEFAATVWTPLVMEGIYAKLVVGRQITYMGSGEPVRIDAFTAAFDSAYAPCDPVQPIGSVAVTCNDTALVYDDITKTHRYPENPSPLTSFIEPGHYYTFQVTGDGRVPSLSQGVAFPVHEPYLTYPTILDTVGADGFEITWQGGEGGTVELIMMSGESQILYVQTDNDGSYTVSSSQLTGLSPGTYSIILNHYERQNILATGYDSRSFISARVMSTSVFQLE